VTAPHRYTWWALFQRTASQAPVLRPDNTTPSGQGSSKQHTPHPLHDAPTFGLSGASGYMEMVVWCGIENKAQAYNLQQNLTPRGS